MITEEPSVVVGITYEVAILITTMKMASPHVSFSIKSVVLRTPMIWLEDAKLEERPPPLEFCTNTTKHIRIAASTINTTNNKYIFFYFDLALIINFSKNLIWSAK